MPYALLTLIWISVAAFGLTVVSGFDFFESANPQRLHVVFALTATTLGLFAHTMTMFYFIGTGKKIKQFIQDWEPSQKDAIRRRIIEMKRKIFPGMTFVCLALMATFILGGAIDAGLLPKSAHAWTAYFAMIYHVHVSTKETLYLFRNIALIYEVNDRTRRQEGSSAASNG